MTEFEAKRLETMIEETLAEYGLTEYVNAFLESDDVKQIITEAYTEMNEAFKFYTRNVPEELKERAEKVFEEWEKVDKTFYVDVCLNFKRILVEKIKLIPKFSIQNMTDIGLITKLFGDEGDIAIQDLKEISDAGKEVVVQHHLEFLYSTYIPADLPEEVVEFLKVLAGGNIIIPVSAIGPEEDDDSDETT